MFEMLLHQRSSPVVTPLTPVSTPPDAHHNSDLSPRSSNSSFVSTDSVIHGSSLHSPNHDRSPPNFSALQRLQFALERNALFSTMLNEQNPDEQQRRLVKPCQSSSSSSLSNSPAEDDEERHSGGGGHELMAPSPCENKTTTPSASPTDDTNPANIIFQCPLCAVVCNSRHEFNEHLVTHSQQYACPKCPFLTDEEDKLREHAIEAHDGEDFEGFDDDEVRTPKTNSQGKMKTFKCKQCGYQAVTKMDFWEHTKGHIRQEKMLTCPKCPFVTEYKHHLEYHLRNHFGSKPFQCNKCAYSCVNKSMLNSHLKSHSNIYQYRCADCSYATKYCHSLKLHLRKYDHKPSMVLNPDGTPNPLPIIDVYGTRRGPKIKRTDPDSGTNQTDSNTMLLSPFPDFPTPKEKSKRTPKRPQKSNNNEMMMMHNNSNNTHVVTSTPPTSPPGNNIPVMVKHEFPPCQPLNMSPTNRNNRNHILLDERALNHNKEPNGNMSNVSNGNIMLQQIPQGIQFPVNQLQAFLLQNSANNNNKMQEPNSPSSVAATLQGLLMQNGNASPMNFSPMNLIGKSPMEIYAAALNKYMVANNPVSAQQQLDLAKVAEEQRNRLMIHILQSQAGNNNGSVNGGPVVAEPEMKSPTTPQEMVRTNMNSQAPLDLRHHKGPVEIPPSNSGNDEVKKRKRKGKAIRYDRNKEFREDFDEDCDNQVLDFSNNNNNNNGSLHAQQIKVEQEPQQAVIRSDIDAENLSCKYCDISFPPVLYELHMRFHSSDADPFRCNVCGTKSSDKVRFFVHLATASH